MLRRTKAVSYRLGSLVLSCRPDQDDDGKCRRSRRKQQLTVSLESTSGQVTRQFISPALPPLISFPREKDRYHRTIDVQLMFKLKISMKVLTECKSRHPHREKTSATRLSIIDPSSADIVRSNSTAPITQARLHDVLHIRPCRGT